MTQPNRQTHALEAEIELHERFVSGRPGGRRLVLRFFRLAGLMLQKRRLSGADLTGCNLSRVRMAAADLSSALLYCCDLRDADLRAANLTNADLRGSSLRGAKLYGARMDGVDLRDARLARAEATGAFRALAIDPDRPLRRISPDGEISQGVDLRHASLKRARLGNARLKGADFSGADMAGADLTGADLRGCSFAETILTGVDLSGVRIDRAALATCVLDPDASALAREGEVRQTLVEAEAWVDSNGSRGKVADLSGLDVRPAADAFAGRRLAGLKASGIRAIEVDFSGSLLTGAVLRHADLRGARFRGCDLRGASFADCQLAFADFTGAVTGVIVKEDGTEVSTDFENANLTGAIFDPAPPVPAPAPVPAEPSAPDEIALAC
jgi:uncharacterized protein YjbI with pentapeptide repeats